MNDETDNHIAHVFRYWNALMGILLSPGHEQDATLRSVQEIGLVCETLGGSFARFIRDSKNDLRASGKAGVSAILKKK